ncbi:DUF6233 domain-containing protein [Streptomyces sp. NBC_00386]|jgi:hypothetical protein|uniref:DUF6233 domain-containing protein n=1 Tax=Streptomyces sp. NBC_00386 TaxID=2975734 RepID=UPI003FCE26D6
MRRTGGDGTGATPDAVHTGDCGTAGKNTRPPAREQDLRAITEDGVTTCPPPGSTWTIRTGWSGRTIGPAHTTPPLRVTAITVR